MPETELTRQRKTGRPRVRASNKFRQLHSGKEEETTKTAGGEPYKDIQRILPSLTRQPRPRGREGAGITWGSVTDVPVVSRACPRPSGPCPRPEEGRRDRGKGGMQGRCRSSILVHIVSQERLPSCRCPRAEAPMYLLLLRRLSLPHLPFLPFPSLQIL
ncbi:hypothetical protein E2C01_061320 [Portunus trituberculatus]|uniref:Uncharacterized protein n=1 Tax=Portunus trituberculatus TaxID=210409 RepID=A0A5B7HEQ7_PORTR|nr:hypothetical protein [Portunus trituberculatus]